MRCPSEVTADEAFSPGSNLGRSNFFVFKIKFDFLYSFQLSFF